MDATSPVVSVDGHRLTLTHLDKVLYPESNTTKADVLQYYVSVAPVLVPSIAWRPATRKRWVHGVGTESAPGPMFFHKNLESGAPEWIIRGTVRHREHANEYPLVNDLATLLWLTQLNALEIHVPQWRFGPQEMRQNPDRLVLDLDPGPGTSLVECAEVAFILRALLTGMGLDPVPVTSGSKGIHLYSALDMRSTSEQISAVAHELARAVEADHPDLVVSTMTKSARVGRVLIDWSQNSAAKTTVTPYSLRGLSHPTVAAPRTWDELAAGDLTQLDYVEVMRRMSGGSDPLGALGSIGTPHRQRTSVSLADPDPLGAYRAKRDATHTPEPVPAALDPTPSTSTGRSFVLHEHHARMSHWDLRLEHNGVLACWALPKGMPTSSAHNHLAVRTEDHPLQYREFEGTIPAGQYGAGTMRIWDAGSAEIEKWRDDEVIVTLYPDGGGGLGGPRRFALIHTAGRGRPDNNWLIHLMAPATDDSTTPVAKNAAARAGLPEGSDPPAYSPMLATTGTPADLRPASDWAVEMKWDGIRILAAVALVAPGPRVRLSTRNAINATSYYPEVVAGLVTALGGGTAVLDGEIVALDSRGRPDFSRLQTRLPSISPPRHGQLPPGPPVVYLIFDILERNGESLLGRTYDERRELLRRSVAPVAAVQIPDAFDGHVEAALHASRELGLEGVVAKRHNSTYRAAHRSHAWIKITQRRTQEVVVGGWRPGRGNRADMVGSLLLGVPHEGTLEYVGRVGTGFTDRDLVRARQLMDTITAAGCPFADLGDDEAAGVIWVRPELVGEVEFAEWTPGRRLRHPSWRGWRPDKTPLDVSRE
ncbi:ATP-dependent DNA ligase [Cryobacterium sp. MLB-32]|uniref:ATP-dependent DNA ligase n=1 Tax=Cryobacterium sp. MLB-32 TaxID=1529318 RepID=UPI0004E741CB|nr:ATP-dependent DNA ligase [Cryobacterium sp. MLB-32]KFF61054.1 ATP-dependent DNA ligase [Cryobacterium sp. MLB-32]